MSKKLRIVPLGGLGEVGKNMMAYEYDDQIMIVDTGIMFPENDMLGIDYIIPDYKYLQDKRDKVKGIVITHGHEDHTGAIRHVFEEFPVPIYGTALTLGLIEVKLERAKLLDKSKLIEVDADDEIEIGPFKVEFCHVAHSIPDCVALGITTPAGFVIHTGDYKFDPTPVDNWPTDIAKLAEWAKRGVMVLLADSTNADKPGRTPSERVIDDAFEQVFNKAKGRILVATFASLLSRVQQVAEACESHDRKIAFVGYSMRENAKMARKLGYLDVPEELVVSLEDALKMPPSKVVLMCTGSQGEPSSIMGRLAAGTNRQFDVKEGDTIILSSTPIPGNEETVHRTINKLIRRGAEVIYDPIAKVHVSGHAGQDEMYDMLHLIKPEFVIPVHGELRHLTHHGILAQKAGIPAENIAVIENGQAVEFKDGKMKLGKRIPGGYVFVDGAGVGDVGPAVVRDREALAKDGFIFVNLRVNRGSGELLRDPEIITRGFVYQKASQELFDAVNKKIKQTVTRANGNLENDLQQVLRSFLYNETKRRPMIFVSVDES
ncbi:MAG: ribonuclease J [Chloroflexi bacterium]|nr:MAG: ribonuclease J [Chloroflexota bacterium]MBL1193926.1 ribonuclease J [Chloroflexota bacterium]NOH11220.1 ribonuclease J [Chloroflexota bacterium]